MSASAVKAARTVRTPAWRPAALFAALALLVAGCGGGAEPAGGDAAAAPIKIGVATGTSGILASYGEMFIEGFKAGLDYATDGTGVVAGHPLEVTYHDTATDAAQATSVVTDLIGKGYKIITGTLSSGVALQIAPLAAQNQILYVSGPAATDKITGVNRYTFRSGRQTYQDVLTAAAFLGDIRGKKVAVFAQDYAFGQANVAAVQQVMGEQGGATVVPILAPLKSNDFIPFAAQIKQVNPDLLFVAWAGDTSAAMWETLEQQGITQATTVVTGLPDRASWETSFGQAFTGIEFLAHYFAEAPQNEVNAALKQRLPDAEVPDIFHPDGFVAAQMIVHAIQEAGGADVEAMIPALEGWTFPAPKGEQTIRAEDHAMLQPMFQAKLVGEGATVQPQLTATLPPDKVAPPVTPFPSGS
ncbi:MAG: substrate-binding domain-containing protein [Actinomycetia bacterium]|nr:substrate-binding domain-containing protein [Actinomycetes bacterium]